MQSVRFELNISFHMQRTLVEQLLNILFRPKRKKIFAEYRNGAVQGKASCFLGNRFHGNQIS